MKWNKVLVSRPYERTTSWVMLSFHVRAALQTQNIQILKITSKSRANNLNTIDIKRMEKNEKTQWQRPATCGATQHDLDVRWALGPLVCAELTWLAGYWSLLHVLMTNPLGNDGSSPCFIQPHNRHGGTLFDVQKVQRKPGHGRHRRLSAYHQRTIIGIWEHAARLHMWRARAKGAKTS